MPSAFAALLYLHLLAAAFWVGGMAVMHFAVRPAAVKTLPPPLRLPFMAASLVRFFVGVVVAIVVLLLSGAGLAMLSGGFGAAHWRVHAMYGLALLMIVIFGVIRVAAFPTLRRAVANADWPAAAAALNRIRQLVALNLALGVVVFGVALLGRP